MVRGNGIYIFKGEPSKSTKGNGRNEDIDLAFIMKKRTFISKELSRTMNESINRMFKKG